VTLVLRSATADDIPVLLEIEEESFSNQAWDARNFLRYDCTVAVVEGRIAGFLVARQTFAGAAGSPPEREILNLAVASPFRRLGIATALLQRELEFEATHFLEVRESNVAARTLYRKLGFVEIGTRREYYNDPIEKAIVMRRK
jgi:ribosomal-protein-alanine N-acetyltransferase